PFARRARCVRRRDAGRPVADGQGRTARRNAAVPATLLLRAVPGFCNLADASGAYPGRAVETPAQADAGDGGRVSTRRPLPAQARRFRRLTNPTRRAGPYGDRRFLFNVSTLAGP